MAESALLDAKGRASVDLGLRTLEFNRHYLLLILGRSSRNMKTETIRSAKEMLHLLTHLVSDSEEVYNGIVWQLVCCPFTPFLTLFGELLSNRGALHADREDALAAMRELPAFLSKMGLRNSLAKKLAGISSIILQHAESVVQAAAGTFTSFVFNFSAKLANYELNLDRTETSTNATLAPAADGSSHDVLASIDDFDWDSFLHHVEGQASNDDQAAPWTNIFLAETNIDWIGLGDTLLV